VYKIKLLLDGDTSLFGCLGNVVVTGLQLENQEGEFGIGMARRRHPELMTQPVTH